MARNEKLEEALRIIDVWNKQALKVDMSAIERYLEAKQVDIRLSSPGVKGGNFVLDVGFVYPIDLIYFAKKGMVAIGVDFAKKTIEKGKIIIKEEKIQDKVSLVRADAHFLPFKNEIFDVVTDFSTLDNIPEDREKVVSEYVRTIKKGGYVVITVTNKLFPLTIPDRYTQWKYGHHPIWEYTHFFLPLELKLLMMNAGLTIEKFDAFPASFNSRFLTKIMITLFRYIPFLNYFGGRIGFRGKK